MKLTKERFLCIFIALIIVVSMPLSIAGCQKDSGKNASDEEEKYTVKYDPAGGTLVSGKLKQTVKEGKDASEPVVSRDGYQFEGWDKEAKDVDEDMVITAQWKKLCTVRFEIGEDAKSDDELEIAIAEGETPNAPDVSRDGYVLNGWDPEIGTVNEDTVYTAVWSLKYYNSSEIYDIASSCVGEITVKDKNGTAYGTGTGFFIDDAGTMITNFHVMKGAYSATVTGADDHMYNVDYVIDYSEEYDIAMIKVNTSGNNYLKRYEIPISTGDKVFTIGSSLGLSGTLSDGIVSSEKRTVDGKTYIQITAPISHGNSGGPLLDENARVIGINTGSLTDGQNLNFAIPIDQIDILNKYNRTPMEEFGEKTKEQDGLLSGDGFFDTADRTEVEPNNRIIVADPMDFDESYAGSVEGEDLDFYSFTVDEPCSILFMLGLDDEGFSDYITAGVVGEKADGSLEALTVFAHLPDTVIEAAEYEFTEPGTYYILLAKNPDSDFNGTINYMVFYTLNED